MKIKMILPALMEAKSPYWRPIKYLCFRHSVSPHSRLTVHPMMRLTCEGDEHVEVLQLDDSPDLVIIQVYITNAFRAYALADHYRKKEHGSVWVVYMLLHFLKKQCRMQTAFL